MIEMSFSNLVRTARLWNKLHQVRKKNQNIAIPIFFYFSDNVHNFNINTTIGCTTSLSTLITSSSTAYI